MPPFLKGKGKGWLTAEYGMLPRSTNTRMQREAAAGKQSGRTQEIQRLIGRSLRAVANLVGAGRAHHADRLRRAAGRRRHAHGQHHRRFRCTARCRAAAAWTAGSSRDWPLRDFVAAVSVGVYQGVPVLDLDYDEDSTCETDMNVVMTGSGGLVEAAGHCGGRAFQPRGARCDGRSCRRRHSAADRCPARCAGSLSGTSNAKARSAKAPRRARTNGITYREHPVQVHR